MPHEIIMPALGMAQDTGLLVAWHKAPGDAVAAGDVLFEVETDKSTMEVEAGYDGFVAALLAEAGDETPVGNVIAVISEKLPDNPVPSARTGNAVRTSSSAHELPSVAKAPASTKTAPPAPAARAAKPAQASAASSGPILASPKARRLALEQGLDLARLVAAGIPQPYHVADLETLKAPHSDANTAGNVSRAHIGAQVPQAGFLDFQSWLAGEAEISRDAIWAAFAAASLRAATKIDRVCVRVETLQSGRAAFYADPDLGPLSTASPCDEAVPTLILRDLSAHRITGITLGTEQAPVLTITSDGDHYVLTLNFMVTDLETDAAIALIDGFAARLEEPVRHIL